MNATPITEKDAANLIGVSLRTIRNAVKRGDLVRIPGTGLVQHVAKEQAELFIGMKWIVKENLSRNDQDKWHNIADNIISPSTPISQQMAPAPILKQEPGMPDKAPSKIYTSINFLEVLGDYLENNAKKKAEDSQKFAENQTSPFLKWLYHRNSMALESQAFMFGTVKTVANKVILGIEAILFIANTLPDNPSEQEIISKIEEISTEIPNKDTIVDLVSEKSAREYLKSLTAV